MLGQKHCICNTHPRRREPSSMHSSSCAMAGYHRDARMAGPAWMHIYRLTGEAARGNGITLEDKYHVCCPSESWALRADAASGGSEAGLPGSPDPPLDSGATKPTRIAARSTATADARPNRPFCVCLAWSLLPSPRLVSVIVSAFCLSCAGEVHALVRVTTAYTGSRCPEPTTWDDGALRYDAQGAALGIGYTTGTCHCTCTCSW